MVVTATDVKILKTSFVSLKLGECNCKAFYGKQFQNFVCVLCDREKSGKTSLSDTAPRKLKISQ